MTSGEAKPKPRVAAGVGPRGINEEDDQMARTSWFDDAEHPLIQEQVTKLASFTDALGK